MRITKADLKNLILETLSEAEEDPTRLKTQAMGSSEFARSGMETRKAASAELTTTEQGIVDQVDKFLLNLANQQGVDLNTNRALIQRIMKLLQGRLAPAEDTPQGEQG